MSTPTVKPVRAKRTEYQRQYQKENYEEQRKIEKKEYYQANKERINNRIKFSVISATFRAILV